MANQDVFTPPNSETPNPVEQNDVTPEALLAQIKNDNGEQKYSDVTKGLQALIHSQEHIKTVEASAAQLAAEKAALEERLKEAATLESVVDRLSARPQAEAEPVINPAVPAVVDEKALDSLIEQRLTVREQATIRASNRAVVNEALEKAYGDKAAEVLQTKAAEMGITPAKMGELAEDSPTLVTNLFFNGAQKGTPAVTTSTINIAPGTGEPEPLKAPEKSLLSGATSDEQADFMRRVKEETYRRLGVET